MRAGGNDAQSPDVDEDLVASHTTLLSSLGSDALFAVVIVVGAWLLAALYLAAWSARAATGAGGFGIEPMGQLVQGIVRRPGDPFRLVDGGGPAGLVWWVWLALVVIGPPVALGQLRRRRRDGRSKGWAADDELEAALGIEATRKRLEWIAPDRPLVAPPRVGMTSRPVVRAGTALPGIVGGTRVMKREGGDVLSHAIRIGEHPASGRPLFATVEESVLLTAPARSGKTRQLVIPTVLGFDGPVLVTSTKVDVLAATYERRRALGPVWVLDPSGISAWPELASWSLTGGCTDIKTAQDRAQAMIDASGGGAGVEDASFWTQKGRGLLSCWLAAAAAGGKGTETVLGWAQTQRSESALESLEAAGLGVLREQLRGFLALEARARDNFWAIASLPLDGLMQASASSTFGAAPGEGLDLGEFFERKGTIYLLADEGDTSPLRGAMTALVSAVTTEAKRRAQASRSGRLDPPVALVLDEAANICPLPAIPSLMSVSGSQSLLLMVVLQTMVQGEQAWGERGMRTLFANARVKLLLGGMSERNELETWSKLAGMYDAVQVSTSHSLHGPSSQASLHRREVIDTAGLRTIPPNRALLLYGRLLPALVAQPSVDDGPDRDEVARSAAVVETKMGAR